MPRDLLQIALEHHRGGRFVQAEEGYRSILASNAQDAEAAHWLGVLRVQAGDAAAAVPLLEMAAAARPEEVAFAHNLGQAYFACGRVDDAIAAFERALVLEPAAADLLFAAGTAYLRRQRSGDADTALDLLNRAQFQGLGTPELHQSLGVALLLTGRVEEAVAACTTAIERKPDYAEAHYHLGVAKRLTGNVNESRRSLAKAVELKPNYVRALHGLAGIEAESGRLVEAEALLRTEVGLLPQSRDAHQALGVVLQRMARWNDATVAFVRAMRTSRGEKLVPSATTSSEAAVARLEQRLTPTPESASLHFRLATKTSIASPSQVPAANVSGLFDRYADLFDEHLLGKLEYRAPEKIIDAVRELNLGTSLDALDLGCGTGLCGPLLRPMCRTLSGVDLSPAMIDKARERGVYDSLETADILDVLRRQRRAWDLLVAADVLMYLGDLAPTFEAAADALRLGGILAFTVEAGEGDRYQLHKQTHRFTHSRPYLCRMASIFGFRQEKLEETILRKEATRDVPGLLMILRLAE